MNWRTRHGLRWRGTRPTLAELGFTLQNIGAIAGLILAFGIVGSIDYAEEQRQEAEQQSARADLNRAALVACINQQAPGLYIERADGVREYLVCGEPYYINNQNTGRRTM